MPDSMSVERRKLLQALGAELVLTPGAAGDQGSAARAERVRGEDAGRVALEAVRQSGEHRRSIARRRRAEILRDTGGKLDGFVAGVGTGGTVTGVGEVLKKEAPHVLVVAVEPVESQVLNGGTHSPHKIQGIGAGMVPAIYDADVVDRIYDVDVRRRGRRRAASGEGRRHLRRHLGGRGGVGGVRDGEGARPRQARRRGAAGHRRALSVDGAVRVHGPREPADDDAADARGAAGGGSRRRRP